MAERASRLHCPSPYIELRTPAVPRWETVKILLLKTQAIIKIINIHTKH